MNKNVSAASLAIIKKMQQNELTESVIYEKIAKFAKGEENKQTLLRLSREEHAHYEIWKKYSGITMKPEKLKVLKFTFLARVLGFTFAVKSVKAMPRMNTNSFQQMFLKAFISENRKKNMNMPFLKC